MLRWRLTLGFLLIASLVFFCWLDFQLAQPGVVLLPVWGVAAMLAVGEVRRLTCVQNSPIAWPSYLGVALTLAAVGWQIYSVAFSFPPSFQSHNASEPLLIALAIGCTLAFVAEIRRYEAPGGVIANVAVAIFPIFYVGLLGSFIVLLRLWGGNSWGMLALVSMIATVKAGDIGAYTVGRLIGKHKMAPVLSPGKTIEGALGAVAFSAATAWLVLRVAGPTFFSVDSADLPILPVLLYGISNSLSGLLGDLIESMLKRDARLKDSSAWLPGFGGVLDILDSLLVAAPVAYVFWAWGLLGPK